ncbi:glycosyltransferase [Candidatus Fermentibacteria bacterium]|nr:glycosyltransferase [Candidatus Fermentibacteria bacterium]
MSQIPVEQQGQEAGGGRKGAGEAVSGPPSVLHLDTGKGWRGGQRQAVELFERMLEAGCRCHFVCRRGSPLQDYLEERDLPFHTDSLRGELDLPSAFRIANFCRRRGYQILYMHTAHALAIGLMAALLNRRLRTVAVRRVDFPVRRNPFSRIKYRTRMLHRIVAISENVRRVLLADGIPPEKITVIRSGIDIHRFDEARPDPGLRASLGMGEGDVLVGTAAAMVGHKDYPNLLRAAEILVAGEPGVHFVAAGTGPLENRIHRLAEDLDLEDRFHFLGRREDMGGFLRSLDVFVLASRMEGLGTATLEAMAVGLPVVGTDAGGIPEIIEDGVCGLVVPREDPAGLARAIQRLCRDSGLRKRFGEASLRRVGQFDIGTTVEKTVDLCRSLV